MKLVIEGLQLLSPNRTSGEHWSKRHNRAKRQYHNVGWLLLAKFGVRPPSLPVVVTLTRVSSRKLDAHENLPMSFKHVADEIARYLGTKDHDPRITWRYAQA